MQKIAILGSTGSLGKKTIFLLEKLKKDFKIVGISANENKELLEAQAKKLGLKKEQIVLAKEDKSKLKHLIDKADIVVNLISGIGGTMPTIYSLGKNKKLLLANKESIVAKGYLFKKQIKNDQIIPIDSEHNSIYEILKKYPHGKIKKIFIPCSGGPFYKKSIEELKKITVKQAISHPKWKMGKKISVESATLINKGFEIIEAHYLFSVPLNKIETFYNPECKIHGIVDFEKIGKIAYYGKPDMKFHIKNALLRAVKKNPISKILSIKKFKFQKVKNKNLKGIETVLGKFKTTSLKMEQFLKKEERVINDFLEKKIKFTEIFNLLK